MLLATRTSGFASLAFLFVAVTSSVVVGATLFPTRGKRFDSDGRRILDLVFIPSLREWHVEKVLYVERLACFKTAFRSGDMPGASEQLERMRKACRTPKDKVLLDIVNHLQEHLISGESVDDCQWSPQAAEAK
jgi:hypothetical protein